MNPQFMSQLEQALQVGVSEQPLQFQQQSEKWMNEDPVNYITHLAVFFADENKHPALRSLAGLTLKNFFPSDERSNNDFTRHRWLNLLPEEAKVIVRENAYNSLKSKQANARGVAAQIIGKIAELDFPQSWNSLLQLLMDLSVSSDSEDYHKDGALKAIGYACEELDPDATPGVSDLVLTAVIHNMNSPDPNLKLSACNALRSSLHFCKKNFGVPEEKNTIFQTVLSTITCGDIDVAVEGFGILVDIVSLYYFELESHIELVFGVTLSAIKEADEEIGKMAIEFWNSICEEEISYREEGTAHKMYAVSAVEAFVPVLFHTITKQDPDYDPDDQNLPVTAAISLNYFAKAVGGSLVDTLMPLVTQNINSDKWNEQDAAILALGAILFVPTETISQLIVEAIPILLNVLENSPVVVVRDTALWTVGQIFHLHPQLVSDKANEILVLMGNKVITEAPRVSSQACWVIHSIGESYGGNPQNPIYSYYGDLIDCLLKTAERPDAGEALLRINAYETLNGLLQHAQEQHYDILSKLYNLVCQELAASINMTGDDIAIAEKQEMLCAMITVLAPHLSDDIHNTHIPLMEVLVNLLNSKNGAAVSSEVFLTITIIAQVLDVQFMQHVPITMQLVLHGIKDIQNQKTCQYATDLLSDMVSLLGSGFLDYSDVILEALFANLRNPELERGVKPFIYEAFSEMALSLGEPFQKYLSPILDILIETVAEVATVDEDNLDEETREYLDVLRKGLFSAFTGVITELKQNDPNLERIYDASESIFSLVERAALSPYSTQDTHYSAIGLVGDLFHKIGASLKNTISPTVVEFIKYCLSSDIDNVREEARRVDTIFRRMNLY